MEESGKKGMTWLDWFLTLAILVLLFVVATFILSSPTTWGWCLGWLDARDWTHWTWTGVIAALIATLLGIRLWPEKPETSPSTEESR
jgi:hypothetical protein